MVVSLALLALWVSAGSAFLPSSPIHRHNNVRWRENVAGLAMRAGPGQQSNKGAFPSGQMRLRAKLLGLLGMCADGRDAAQEEVAVHGIVEESTCCTTHIHA